MNVLIQMQDINNIISIFKIYFISICTYYVTFKIINKPVRNLILSLIIISISSMIYVYVKTKTNFLCSTVFLILILSVMLSNTTKDNIEHSILIIIISLSINYVIFFTAIAISFIPNVLLNIKNIIKNVIILLVIYILLIYVFSQIKKIKRGLIVLKNKIENDYFSILILNISVIILFTIIIITYYKMDYTLNYIFVFIIFSIIMFITIQKSLQLYYKQKLLEQELNETKDELEKKKEKVKQLEAENLNFSKTSHTLAHKQKSLEYKLEQLKQKYEIAEEIEIEDRIKDISKEIYNKTPEVEISKTGILEIDDMLKYMQSECIKNNIEFRLQIKGNIYEMINNYISKEDLSILIADHVKNAIIAINYSENINKSILVRLGKINKIYSLYIYDSGIEFEKETLSNLGKIPSTTHADNGGTGMGFMNTFDTLRKYNASLIINEYNKPSNDNYTKSIVIKLDRRNEFTINSYKDKINN